MPSIDYAALVALLARILARNGYSASNAHVLAETMAMAERDAAHSHGVFRLEGYLGDARSGWAKGDAVARLLPSPAALILVDADNGHAQPAWRRGRDRLVARAGELGLAGMVIRNSHHLAALWPEVEDLAEAGLVGLNFRGTRPFLALPGGRAPLLGTNPWAFACPRAGQPPIVFDMASSAMARGDMLLAAREGRAVPEGAGLDAAGLPTTDPAAITGGGVQLPFGGIKGGLVALMVELLANALTGSLLALQDQSAEVKGAATANGGQLILAINPGAAGGQGFAQQVEMLAAALEATGARMPGARRHAARALSQREGIPLAAERLAELHTLAGD